MELEELQSKLSELEAEKEAILSKNKEILGELKKLKQQTKEVDAEKYFAMADELETLKDSYQKLEKQYRADTEKLTKGLSEKDSVLQKLIVDDGLTNALTKAGVKPEFLDATKAFLREKTALKQNGDKYEAIIADKPLNDYIGEWINTEGKAFIAAPQNSGGGASGGNGTTPSGKTKGDIGGDKVDRVTAIKQKFNLEG